MPLPSHTLTKVCSLYGKLPLLHNLAHIMLLPVTELILAMVELQEAERYPVPPAALLVSRNKSGHVQVCPQELK